MHLNLLRFGGLIETVFQRFAECLWRLHIRVAMMSGDLPNKIFKQAQG